MQGKKKRGGKKNRPQSKRHSEKRALRSNPTNGPPARSKKKRIPKIHHKRKIGGQTISHYLGKKLATKTKRNKEK